MEYFNDEGKNVAINFEYQERRYLYKGIKRIFDFVASFIGLVLLSPLFLIVAIAIKIEDPKGPVFYSQIRLGKKQEPFKMYKFRSMVVDADKHLKELLDENEIEGAMFKMKEDPRVTKVGEFIRKYSIDELPQLVNVLLGNMSLVGPRPPLPREVKEYTEYDKLRLAVKPGCTGLWQISGRNDVGFHEMVELDLKYIDHRGFWFDMYVLFKTVGVFVHPNAAY
ncbi:sugar transferase [Companilactobacillus pabuli]|uniref:Sugar transferase n=1 Tax=Companilactobacillus pabuli TaxID=2714036 RepID=A0A7L7KU80_9LACO|nr:sugar transferase [Companilactobacillus pabuli]AKP03252.1 multidrug MFS transporter [Companilactobacillus farciminis]AKS51552.1 multidrug MFS transporter [Companilactobacillus farciminis]QMT83327.1 sugar transferase [Companilactobacillus pabuli]GAQ02582.1 multidrug MFS transporter [Companilactobacillus farciminis]